MKKSEVEKIIARLRDPEPRKHDIVIATCRKCKKHTQRDSQEIDKPCPVPDPFHIPEEPGTDEYNLAMGIAVEMFRDKWDDIFSWNIVDCEDDNAIIQLFEEATPLDLFRIIAEAEGV